jgi:methionyl-tRNA formyltransferase
LLGIETIQPDDVNGEQARAAIAGIEPEAVLICAYGALVKEPLLSAHDMLNVHPSLLPRWRGAAPIERAIDAGDEQTGVTIMRPTAELDAGPICLQRAEAIHPDDDYGSLAGRLAALGGELLVEALDTPPAFHEQPEQGVTYAEKIDPAERRLDPTRPATELAAVVRALTPHIGAYLETADGERLGVRRARAVDVSVKTGALKSEWGALLVGCCRGALRLDVVQPPGGKPMPVDAYLRGHSLPKL